MARLQQHHVTYDPEWMLEITLQQHQCISRIQSTKATPEQYAHLVNFLHAVSFECNRMRMELDLKGDHRQRIPEALRKARQEIRNLKKRLNKNT